MDVGAAVLVKDNTGFAEVKMLSNDEGVGYMSTQVVLGGPSELMH